MTLIEIMFAIGNALILVLVAVVWKKLGTITSDDNSKALREEMGRSRSETAKLFVELRKEVRDSIHQGNTSLSTNLKNMGEMQVDQLASIQKTLTGLTKSNQEQIDGLRGSVGEQLKELRAGNEKKLEDIQTQVKTLIESNQKQIDVLRESVAKQLKQLQDGNEKKLDEMRKTVDEHLQTTLTKRLGEAFNQVSERLEKVHRGLGEMKGLVDGVGDLKRVLTNVKARGTWGEVQLGAIPEQLLTKDQFESNVKTKAGSDHYVEFAIKLPGLDEERGSQLYLPIDSKFPQEDYLRLSDAAEKADVAAVEESTKALVRSVKNSAKSISEKYIDPPGTTDFAIMFLPTEGLFAEVLRQPGLMEDLQVRYRVVVAGPTTLSAIISSLRLGFRTLAIEKRSAEVWHVLSGVKTEFGKFGAVLERIKKQLTTVSNTIDSTQTRTRAMERKLKDVQELPADEAAPLLGLDLEEDLEEEETFAVAEEDA
jgi:DNA recombination protein RmuC